MAPSEISKALKLIGEADKAHSKAMKAIKTAQDSGASADEIRQLKRMLREVTVT